MLACSNLIMKHEDKRQLPAICLYLQDHILLDMPVNEVQLAMACLVVLIVASMNYNPYCDKSIG